MVVIPVFSIFMNFSHAHLYLNHLPVVGMFFSLLLYGVAWKLKNETVEKVAIGFLTLSALLIVPAYLTGEPAEESYSFPSGTEYFIEEHEEMGKVTLIAGFLVGLFGLLGLTLKRAPWNLFFKRACVIVSGFTAILLVITASRGGQIRHTEIRSNSTPAEQSPTPRESSEGENEHDDADEI
jgi:hypothetical protein